jgi:hypothetical protein
MLESNEGCCCGSIADIFSSVLAHAVGMSASVIFVVDGACETWPARSSRQTSMFLRCLKNADLVWKRLLHDGH